MVLTNDVRLTDLHRISGLQREAVLPRDERSHRDANASCVYANCGRRLPQVLSDLQAAEGSFHLNQGQGQGMREYSFAQSMCLI